MDCEVSHTHDAEDLDNSDKKSKREDDSQHNLYIFSKVCIVKSSFLIDTFCLRSNESLQRTGRGRAMIMRSKAILVPIQY